MSTEIIVGAYDDEMNEITFKILDPPNFIKKHTIVNVPLTKILYDRLGIARKRCGRKEVKFILVETKDHHISLVTRYSKNNDEYKSKFINECFNVQKFISKDDLLMSLKKSIYGVFKNIDKSDSEKRKLDEDSPDINPRDNKKICESPEE